MGRVVCSAAVGMKCFFFNLEGVVLADFGGNVVVAFLKVEPASLKFEPCP